MDEKIYEALVNEPNVDMVIIAERYGESNDDKFWIEFNRAYTLESLAKEAKLVWDES